MSRTWQHTLVTLALLLLSRCGGEAEEQPSEPFKVMVITDTHIQGPGERDALVLGDLVSNLNGGKHPGVRLLLVSGDVADALYPNYTSTRPDTSGSRLKTLISILEVLTLPFYMVPGNHDYKLGPSYYTRTAEEKKRAARVWKDETGQDSYHAHTLGGFVFVGLDSYRGRYETPDHYFDDEQLTWLERTLDSSSSTPAVLYFHYPIWTDHDLLWTLDKSNIIPRSQNRIFDILTKHASRIKAIFVGHGHVWVRDKLYGTIEVYETGSLGKTMPDVSNYHLLACDPASGAVTVTNGRDADYFEAK